MKIIVLTTNTPHHLYFINEISTRFEISGIVIEKKQLTSNFEIFHSFEEKRDIYEKNELLQKKDLRFENYSQTISVNNINDKECLDYIKIIQPDVIIAFGVGIVRERLIKECPEGFINLHGGDPEYYRGLDSHLWAIYHKDFSHLIVTLHRLNPKLDDGEIIHQKKIKLNNQLSLYKLRSENTKICVELVLSALSRFKQKKEFISKPQQRSGRYYSFMPSVLKEICLKYYNNHLKNLK